ncbi:allantoate amidohydrolase [Acetobacter okinawensis]|uniref:allantoate amidohydrolase n=1 Tax=Acetobacter okinawensis TaxID=1076594 RepID=UPI0039ECD77C
MPPSPNGLPEAATVVSRPVSRCDHLGVHPFSDTQDGLFRAYLSDAHRSTCQQVAQWMHAAGMTSRTDAAGNLIGRYEGQTPGAPALLIGSHLDTVRNAGRYDGTLGVMLGIEVVAHLAERGERLPFAIEVIGFGDEEGSRFPASMLTSRAVAGTLDTLPLDAVDASGSTLGDVLHHAGLDPARYREAAYTPEQVVAYLEAHIEQGPVLEAADMSVGVVTAIAAQYRFKVSMVGVAGHAGTMPMSLRKDALAAAAQALVEIERIGASGPADLVATVGQLHVGPGASNVVPGHVTFSLDIRAGTADVRDRAATKIRTALQDIADTRGVALRIELQNDLAPTPCDPELTARLATSVARITGQPAHRLVSGAGHDAMVMAALTPVCMLFLRCHKGISHNPAEAVRHDDAHTALLVMLDFIQALAATPAPTPTEFSA